MSTARTGNGKPANFCADSADERPPFDVPSRFAKNFRRGLTHIAETSNQNARHGAYTAAGAISISVKRIVLHCANLFESNQFKQGEESHHDLDARRRGGKQFRKSHGRSVGDALQNLLDLVRDRKIFAENLRKFSRASTRLSTIWNALINWKIPTSPRRSGALVSVVGAAIARKYFFLLELRATCSCCCRFLELLVFDQLPDQFPARIVFVDIFLGRLLIHRQQTATLPDK